MNFDDILNPFNYIPGVILFWVYQKSKEKDMLYKAKEIEAIIKSNYQKVLLTNALGYEIELISYERRSIGYKITFKLPLAYNINKIKDLEEVLNAYDPFYGHVIYERDEIKETKSINSRYIDVYCVDFSKSKMVLTPDFKSNKKRRRFFNDK